MEKELPSLPEHLTSPHFLSGAVSCFLCSVLEITVCRFGFFFITIGKKIGLVRESNPGPLAPEARIIPLDQRACQ